MDDFQQKTDAILFVDDTNELLDLVTGIASKIGFHTYRANHAKEALDIFQENLNIKLVFCDLNLGQDEENGLELIRDLAAFKESRFLKLCLLTGERSGNIKEIAQSLGADAYMPKPINPGKFKELILDLLNIDDEQEVDNPNIKISLDNVAATIQESNIRPILLIKELTTHSLVMESSAEIEAKTIIKIYSQRLSKMINCSPYITLKIEKCKSFHQVAKESGETWFDKQPHLKPHNDAHFLVRCRITDLSGETRVAIEMFHRVLQEKKHKNAKC